MSSEIRAGVNLILPRENSGPLVEKWWQPLGLVSVGTSLPQGTEVMITDETFKMARLDNESESDPTIYGWSAAITSYETACKEARDVKAINPNAITLLGGAYPTSHAREIVVRRPEIDAVVIGDGEPVLPAILKFGISPQVPNLVYVPGSYAEKMEYLRIFGSLPTDAIVTTPVTTVNLKITPFPDLSLLNDLDERWEVFGTIYPEFKGWKIFSTAAQRGCPYRAGENRGCLFCSRIDGKYRLTDANQYARYVQSLEQNYDGPIVIEESSDDFVGSKVWLRQFANAYRELGLRSAYRIFARADNITEETAGLLKNINTRSVFIGYESGNEEILQGVCDKGLSLGSARAATDLLHKITDSRGRPIEISGAFIFGFPNETKRTIKDTLDFAEEVIGRGVTTISASILTPLRPSRAWKLMMGVPELRARYGDTDNLDYLALQESFVGQFCQVNFQQVLKAVEDLQALAQREGAAFSGDFMPQSQL